MAESDFTLARALLDHRRSRFAQRLVARPRGGQGPEVILGRDSTLTARLRRVAAISREGTAEGQGWSFPGNIIIDEREPALRIASEWSLPDTIWTDGSRQEGGRVRAACVWRTQEEWT